MADEREQFDQWAILELMGHVRLAGRVSEEERFGCKVGRIDVPDGDGFITQYFGGQSICRLTVVSEEVARSVANASKKLPIHAWELPQPALPSPVRSSPEPEEDEEDDDYEDREEDTSQYMDL